MKSSVRKRLQNLESTVIADKKHKCALLVYDPDILHTFDFSFVEAEHFIILPDNGLRVEEEPPIPKGSYRVTYL